MILIPLLFIFGWLLTRLLNPSETRIGDFGLAWLLGTSISALLYFILHLNPLYLLSSSILITLILNIFLKRPFIPQFIHHKFHLFSKLLLVLSFLIFLYPIIQLLYWPPYTPDAISLYDFRAQLLLHDGNFNFLSQFDPGTLSYPPLTSLMHFFFYRFGASTPNWFYVLTFLGLLLILFDSIYYFSQSTLAAAVGILGTLLTPVILWTSFLPLATFVYMVFLTASVCYFLRHQFVTAGLLLGLSTFIRGEPFWTGVLFILILICFQLKKIYPFILSLILFYPLACIWPGYTQSHRSIRPIAIIKTETGAVARQIQSQRLEFHPEFLINPLKNAWSILPLIYLLLLLNSILFYRRNLIIDLSPGLIAMTLILGFCIYSTHNPEWRDLDDSLYRLAALPVPLFWLSLATKIPLWLKRS